jgi:hypothetical protein
MQWEEPLLRNTTIVMENRRLALTATFEVATSTPAQAIGAWEIE